MAFHIGFFPVPGSPIVEYTVSGSTLTVNGDIYDFTALVDGATLLPAFIPGSASWLRSTEVTRSGGDIYLCVVAGMAADEARPHVRHPDNVAVASGRVPLPTD